MFGNSCVFAALLYGVLLVNLCCGTAWKASQVPQPRSQFIQCGVSRPSSLCDLDNVFPQTIRERFVDKLRGLPYGTPCYCRCSYRDNPSSKKLAVGLLMMKDIYIPPNSTKSFHTHLTEFSRSVKKRWALGQCNGNDALVVVVRRKIYVFYGKNLERRLSPRCQLFIVQPVVHQSAVATNVLSVLKRIRSSLTSRCGCRRCYSYNWFKLMAWVFAGVFLLSFLSFFGRRMWMRQGMRHPVSLGWSARNRGSSDSIGCRTSTSQIAGRARFSRGNVSPLPPLPRDTDMPPAQPPLGGNAELMTPPAYSSVVSNPPPYPGPGSDYKPPDPPFTRPVGPQTGLDDAPPPPYTRAVPDNNGNAPH